MIAELAIVTGAGRGIGRAVAIALASGGVPVLAISKTDTACRTAAEIETAGGVAHALQADLEDPASAQDAVSRWLESSSARRLVVVLAAGVLGPSGGLTDVASMAEWEIPYRVNLLGNMAVLRAALPRMLEAGYGRVVSLAGGGAAAAYPEFSAYACSKTAIVREIENLAVQYSAHEGLVFVALAPGAVETDMLARVKAEGGSVRTTTSLQETVRFVEAIASQEARALSGRFVHVRDDWSKHLGAEGSPLPDARWKLRRIE
jgi:NAD(P)-dependent dehydrogenase (short-subunit alcohol dehydrogenase family)